MEIKNSITFSVDSSPKMIRYLIENKLPYREGHYFTTVDIYESSPHWVHIQKIIKENNLLCHSNPVFTKGELENAKWLRVWSQWRCGYPQPENTFMTSHITYSRENYCNECGCGEVQIAPFRMKKEPKWGKRHFAELNWIGDELFVSKTAKDILESNNISGISFQTVNNKNGTDSFDDIFQMVVPFVLNPGLIEEATDFEKISQCSICGQKKYVPSGTSMKSFCEDVFLNVPDVVKTSEIFGDMRYASREIIVRQNFYQVIVQNGLGLGLVFEPIRLVGKTGDGLREPF